jgi:hypothetical protein
MSIARFFNYADDVANYHSNVSDIWRYYFFANPKVASTTILYVLQTAERNGTPPLLAHLHDRAVSPLRSFGRHAPAEAVLTGDAYFKFAYVRNPFTRIFSCYLDKMVKDQAERRRLAPMLGFSPDDHPTFREFLDAIHAQPEERRDSHWANQSYLLQMNNIAYDFIGRYESFAQSFPLVLKRIGIPLDYFADAEKDARHATNSGSQLQKNIGEEEKKIILDIYRPDFTAFAYGTDVSMARG